MEAEAPACHQQTPKSVGLSDDISMKQIAGRITTGLSFEQAKVENGKIAMKTSRNEWVSYGDLRILNGSQQTLMLSIFRRSWQVNGRRCRQSSVVLRFGPLGFPPLRNLRSGY